MYSLLTEAVQLVQSTTVFLKYQLHSEQESSLLLIKIYGFALTEVVANLHNLPSHDVAILEIITNIKVIDSRLRGFSNGGECIV